jgi:hypothetical protein
VESTRLDNELRIAYTLEEIVMLRPFILTALGVLVFERSALADATMDWATDSPSTPQSGWIQGAGTFLPSDIKKKIKSTQVTMECVDGKGQKFVSQTGSGKDGVWTAVRTGLDPGEYECQGFITIMFDDNTFETGKTSKKKFTLK